MKLFYFLKHSFIPHKGNDHKPHFLRAKVVFVFLSVILFVQVLFASQVLVLLNKTDFFASVLPSVLTFLTNEKRTEENIPALANNSLLQKAAELKARDMAEKGYFAHITPDGKDPWFWLDQVGYNYKYAGENLAVNFIDSSDVVDAWMNSPGHRANIEKPNYTEIGIATASGIYKGKETVFVVQFFGSPAEPALTGSTTLAQTEPKKTISTTTIATAVGAVKGAEASPILKKSSIEIAKKIITEPRRSSKFVLDASLALFFIALVLKIAIKFRIQHHALILNGLIGLMIISSFLLVHEQLFSQKIAISSSEGSATISVALVP